MNTKSTMRRYTFEVVRLALGQFEHLGYMKISFASRNDAEKYYKETNPRMPPLNGNVSDVHPEGGLVYILREDYGISAKISPFHTRTAAARL